MATLKSDHTPRSTGTDNRPTDDMGQSDESMGRKPTEREKEQVLDWAEGFKTRHEGLFDRLANY